MQINFPNKKVLFIHVPRGTSYTHEFIEKCIQEAQALITLGEPPSALQKLALETILSSLHITKEDLERVAAEERILQAHKRSRR
jgi:hypothetical protein